MLKTKESQGEIEQKRPRAGVIFAKRGWKMLKTKESEGEREPRREQEMAWRHS